MEYSEQILPLNREDKKLLIKNQRKMQIALISFMLFALFMGFAAKAFSDSNGFLIAVTIIVVIPVCVYLFIYSTFKLNDVKKGYKLVISGTISEKKIATTQTKEATNIDSQRQTQYYSRYYFIIGSRQIQIPEEVFNQYETGSIIEIHQTESESFLGVYALKSENLQSIIQTPNKQAFTNEDLLLFIKIRNKSLKKLGIMVFIFGFIGYWITFFIETFVVTFWFRQYLDKAMNISQWALILLILLIAWFVNKKTILNYYFDTKQLQKFVSVLPVSDKLTSNTAIEGKYQVINSSAGYYYLKADNKLYHVNELLYNSVKPGDKIKVGYSVFAGVQLHIDKK